MEQKRDFSIEGLIELGPRADYFVFVDGDFLGRMLSQHAKVKPKEGEYTRLGRARITVEWLDDELTEVASPSNNRSTGRNLGADFVILMQVRILVQRLQRPLAYLSC